MAASSGSPNGARIVHHETYELLLQQNSCLGEGQAFPVFAQLSFWPERYEATRSAVNERITPRKRAVSTHWIGSPRNSTGRGLVTRKPALAKSIALLLGTLERPSIRSATSGGRWNMILSS